jgi:serine/threonine-protein kinase
MHGAVIGSYRLVEKIGEGGMGTVWVAEHTLIGRRAAMKLLLPAYSSNASIVQRFFNEARAVAAIADPGIVQIFDFGVHADGTAYIVMELLAGETLEARLRRVGRLSALDAVRLVRQVAVSLATAHGCGVIHRDLKPENLFVVGDPAVTGGERPKVLDFGIAKLTGEDSKHKTRTGMMLGTPMFMSPEQCRGAGGIDHRTDVYSLGAVLFCLVVGRPPFEGEGSGDVIIAHVRDQPPVPSSLAAVPPALDAVILRCLEKQPARRFQTMEELAAALAQVDHGLRESAWGAPAPLAAGALAAGPGAIGARDSLEVMDAPTVLDGRGLLVDEAGAAREAAGSAPPAGPALPAAAAMIAPGSGPWWPPAAAPGPSAGAASKVTTVSSALGEARPEAGPAPARRRRGRLAAVALATLAAGGAAAAVLATRGGPAIAPATGGAPADLDGTAGAAGSARGAGVAPGAGGAAGSAREAGREAAGAAAPGAAAGSAREAAGAAAPGAGAAGAGSARAEAGAAAPGAGAASGREEVGAAAPGAGAGSARAEAGAAAPGAGAASGREAAGAAAPGAGAGSAREAGREAAGAAAPGAGAGSAREAGREAAGTAAAGPGPGPARPAGGGARSGPAGRVGPEGPAAATRAAATAPGSAGRIAPSAEAGAGPAGRAAAGGAAGASRPGAGAAAGKPGAGAAAGKPGAGAAAGKPGAGAAAGKPAPAGSAPTTSGPRIDRGD